MIILGLTGSIASGKSTTAQMFRDAGVPVYDADAAVALLYAEGGAAVAPIAALIPGAVKDDAVDREALREAVFGEPALLKKVEAIAHPLAARMREEFLRRARKRREWLVVLDIPLLFETSSDRAVDRVLVVTAPAAIRRTRALKRDGVTPARFAAIAARQTPDDEKRRRAHFIIDTSLGLEHARECVAEIMAELREETGA